MSRIDFSKKYKGGRPRCELRTASKESYLRFIKENPKVKVSREQYVEILKELNHQYVIYVLETAKLVKLPYGFGGLMVSKHKGAKTRTTETGVHVLLAIDWGESQKQDKLCYYRRQHTDGYSCNWRWIKVLSRIKTPEIWNLKMSKINKKLLSEYSLDPEGRYYQKYRELDFHKQYR